MTFLSGSRQHCGENYELPKISVPQNVRFQLTSKRIIKQLQPVSQVRHIGKYTFVNRQLNELIYIMSLVNLSHKRKLN